MFDIASEMKSWWNSPIWNLFTDIGFVIAAVNIVLDADFQLIYIYKDGCCLFIWFKYSSKLLNGFARSLFQNFAHFAHKFYSS